MKTKEEAKNELKAMIKLKNKVALNKINNKLVRIINFDVHQYFNHDKSSYWEPVIITGNPNSGFLKFTILSEFLQEYTIPD